jgi:hypothetical protein
MIMKSNQTLQYITASALVVIAVVLVIMLIGMTIWSGMM